MSLEPSARQKGLPFSKNDIQKLHSVKQVEIVDLDLDSPRMKIALKNLFLTKEDFLKKDKNDFFEKGIDQDIIEVRYQHHRNKLLEHINNALEERKRIQYQQLGRQSDQGSRNKLQFLPVPSQHNQDLVGKVTTGLQNHLSKMVYKDKAFNSVNSRTIEHSRQRSQHNRSANNSATNFHHSTIHPYNQNFAFITQVDEYFDQKYQDQLAKQQQKLRNIEAIRMEEKFQNDLKHQTLQKKIEKAEKLSLKALKQATTRRQIENDKKMENARINHKDMIRKVEQKAEQDRVKYLKEFEERQTKMKEKSQRRVYELAQKDIENMKEKEKRIQSTIQRELKEQQECEKLYKQLLDKQEKNKQEYNSQLQEKLDRIHQQNTSQTEKFFTQREHERSMMENNYKQLQNYQQKEHQRIKSLYKQMNKLLQSERDSKNYSFQETMHNFKVQDKEFRQTLAQKQRDKFNRVNKTIDEQNKEMQKDLMLKKEQRRLKDQDISQRLDREKRKEWTRKFRILEREASHSRSLEKMKHMKETTTQMKRGQQMQSNIEREALRSTLQDWVHKGFSASGGFNTTNRSVNDLFDEIKTKVKGKKNKEEGEGENK